MKVKELQLNLRPLIKKLEMGLKKGYSEEVLSSTFKSVFRGKGMEFDGFRAYTPDDDAKEIDWKASLRSGDLLVRVLSEERNITIFFVFDVSDSMIFTSTDKLKCEYAAELIATIGFGAVSAHDSVGMCMFNDRVVQIVPGMIGMPQFYKITKNLSDPHNYGGGYDLDFALKYAIKFLKRGTIVFIVSDFIGLSKDWKDSLRIMSRKFDLIGVMVRDPRDNMLPAHTGEFVLGDPFSDADILVDVDSIMQRFEQYAKEQIQDVEDTFTSVGADFLMLQTDEEFIRPVLKLFSRRKQKWR